MRYHEIASGFRLPVSGEEQALLNRAGKHPLVNADLDERDAEMCRRMVGRGLLDRRMTDKGETFHVSSVKDIWRDPHDR